MLLSLQRALWEVVTPALRGVTVRFDDSRITARFLFAEEPNAQDREDVSLAETFTIADFEEHVNVAFILERVPAH